MRQPATQGCALGVVILTLGFVSDNARAMLNARIIATMLIPGVSGDATKTGRGGLSWTYKNLI